MTAKRFTIKSQDDYFGITDNNVEDKMNVINGIHTEIEAKWLCDLLNALHEENEQLKHDIKFLKSDKDKLDKYHSRLVYHMNKFAGEKNYAETLSNLSEENDQLKATIKEAYENERTALGKSVLKQLIDKME